ncbi:MAG: hypothetical protein ACI8TA_003094 [Cyclobacteriaceae bacterium]|jgi:hypothetical protein
MRINILIICFLITTGIFAQFKTVPIRTNQLRHVAQSDRVLQLPFWDDFSTTTNTPDTLLWKIGQDVFINEGLSKNPPTYKVATLDGLRGNGIAYDILNEFFGPTDTLASHIIDLSNYNISDSLYLSFYWQSGGFGELPDQEDTISLHFLASDSTWERVWYSNGGLESLNDYFTQAILPFDSSKYFHDGFRFMFESVARQSGPFDTWHLDYIYLNKARSKADTLHFDRSLTGVPSPLFAPYQEIPAHIFFKDPGQFLKPQTFESSNLDDTPHPIRYYYRLENLITNEVYYDQLIDGAPVTISALQIDSITGPDNVLIDPQLNPLDSQRLQTTFYMFTGDKKLFEEVNGTDTVFLDVDLRINDTIRQQYALDNHYAYDDGTAEYAAGINVKNGKLAVKFYLPEPDTLTHIDIHFPNIVPDATGKSINLIVWSNLKNNVILTSQPFKITSNSKLNEYKRIKLERSLLVKDTVFIGFQQLIEDYIGVGFDKSNIAAMNNIYYNTGESWIQNNRLEGIFMIRPIFKYDSTFILSNKSISKQISVFPNPSSGQLNISTPIEHLSVYDMSGTLVYNADSGQNHDISFLQNGLYLVKIYADNQTQHLRVVLNR